MAVQLVPNGIEIVMNGDQNGVPIVNVLWSRTAGEVVDSDLSDAVSAVKGWWTSAIRPYIHSTYILNSITATDKSVEGGHQYTQSYVSSNQGLLTGAAAAANAAAVISWRTARIGRSYRGRTYIGGLDNSVAFTAQEMTTDFQTLLTTAGAGLIDALNGIGQSLSVLSRVLGGVLRVTGLLTEIVGVVVDIKLDSQRRRTAN